MKSNLLADDSSQPKAYADPDPNGYFTKSNFESAISSTPSDSGKAVRKFSMSKILAAKNVIQPD